MNKKKTFHMTNWLQKHFNVQFGWKCLLLYIIDTIILILICIHTVLYYSQHVKQSKNESSGIMFEPSNWSAMDLLMWKGLLFWSGFLLKKPFRISMLYGENLRRTFEKFHKIPGVWYIERSFQGWKWLFSSRTGWVPVGFFVQLGWWWDGWGPNQPFKRVEFYRRGPATYILKYHLYLKYRQVFDIWGVSFSSSERRTGSRTVLRSKNSLLNQRVSLSWTVHFHSRPS